MSAAKVSTRTGEAFCFRAGVQLEKTAEAIQVISPWGNYAVAPVDAWIEAALRRLAGPPVSKESLASDLEPRRQRQVGQVMDRFRHLICRCVMAGTEKLARLEMTTRDTPAYQPVDIAPTVRVRLSRFAFCRSYNGEFVLESPLVGYRAVLCGAAAQAVIAALGGPVSARDLPGWDATVSALVGHLGGAGFVDLAEDAPFPADRDPVLGQWEFHDLLFHTRTRLGRYDEPFGAVFPYVGDIEPEVPVKPRPDGPSLSLYRPRLDELLARDPGLSATMEGRTSVRTYGENAMTDDQLGEFLYRVARVRSTYGPGPGMPYEATSRPYPCGGAAYELELYVTVRRCAGIAAGIYYYDPVGHQLVLVNDDAGDRQAMLHMAWVSTACLAVPDVLVTMTSRFQRLSWKYRAIAYSVTLKHVGVLYQTMYLVATAMGLAPCGLGSGHADLASGALGLDYLRESAVGEFILGSRPAPADANLTVPPNWQPVNDPGWAGAARTILDNGAG